MPIILCLAWRNLWRHPRRTWLTTAAMVFSNTLLVFVISLQFGMYDMMIENTLKAFSGHLQVQALGYKDEPRMYRSVPNILPVAAQLRDTLDTENISARAFGFALASSEERSYGIQIVGVEPSYEPQVSSLPGLIKPGRFFSHANAQEMVVGELLARNLKIQVGDEITLLGSGRDGSFAAAVVTLVGIFNSGVADLDRGLAQMPLQTFQSVFTMEGHGHSIVVNASDLAGVSDLHNQLSAALINQNLFDPKMPTDKIVVLDWNRLQPGLKQSVQADMVSAWFMYSVLIILVAFSVLNTQLMSVLERTREFGIVMSLGLTPGRLGRLVLLETALMAGLGFLVGVFLGYLIVLWLGQVGFYYPGMEEMAARFNLPDRMYPSVSLFNILLGPMVVFVACLLAAIYPALRLYFLQPVQAMRAV